MQYRQVRAIEKNELIGIISIYNSNVFHHKIDSKNNLMPGTSLTKQAAKRIFKKIVSDKDLSDHYFKDIPKANVLYYNQEKGKIVWYTLPQKRKILYKNDLKEFTGIYDLPILLWSYNNGSSFVCALKRIPESFEDKTFNAPFMNVNENGSICTGDIKFNKTECFEFIMSDFESKFFNSYFTHTNNNNILSMNFSTYMKEAKDVDFDIDSVLIPNKKTIKDFL